MGKAQLSWLLVLVAGLVPLQRAPAQQPAQEIIQVSASQSAVTDATYKRLLDQLTAIGERLAKTHSQAELASYSLLQADVLAQILPRVKEDERPVWLRQLIDALFTASVNSPPQNRTAYDRLAKLHEQLEKATPQGALVAYAAFQTMEADHMAKASVPGTDHLKLQEEWNKRLNQFIIKFPKAEETPGAVFQLAEGCEALGRDNDAKRCYEYLVARFPEHALATKAKAALRWQDLEGKELRLALPLLFTEDERFDIPFDIDQLRGKVTVVYFWASTASRCTEDMNAVLDLLDRYHDKGVELLCVGMDKTPAEAREYLRSSRKGEIHVFQRNGLDSLLAQRCGVTSLPALLVVAKDGTVACRSAGALELEMQVKKRLNDPSPTKKEGSVVAGRHWPWTR
jgi:hypothetical protein